MSNAVVALIFAIGVAAWVYNKTQKSTGNNTQTSLIVAGIVGLLAFILGMTLMGLIPN